MKTLELYVHIPFCAQKCSYCDFLSMPSESTVKKAYIRKLKEEIAFWAPKFTDRQVVSVFFGGGTPSILPPGEICSLLSCIKEGFIVAKDAEISIECNPGTLDVLKLRA